MPNLNKISRSQTLFFTRLPHRPHPRNWPLLASHSRSLPSIRGCHAFFFVTSLSERPAERVLYRDDESISAKTRNDRAAGDVGAGDVLRDGLGEDRAALE